MQKILIAVLAVATAALGVICAMQRKQLQAGSQQLSATREELRAEVEQRQADAGRIKELKKAEARLEKQVQDFTKVTTTLRASEATQSSNVTALAQKIASVRNGGTNGGDGSSGNLGKGMGEMLGTLMKDPAMREMMQEQQKATIKMMYAGLFKDLKLTGEEKDQFVDLLTKSQMNNIAAAQTMMGDKSKEGMEQMQKQITDAKSQSDADIKALLGDERFAQYTDYQKNIGERMQLDQFSSRLQAANIPLQDQQMAQLLQLMKNERDAVPPVIPSDANQTAQAFGKLTPENLDKQLKWMEDYNQRVLKGAGRILNPEQLRQFREFQEQQASMQKLGLKMAREMFGGSR